MMPATSFGSNLRTRRSQLRWWCLHKWQSRNVRSNPGVATAWEELKWTSWVIAWMLLGFLIGSISTTAGQWFLYLNIAGGVLFTIYAGLRSGLFGYLVELALFFCVVMLFLAIFTR